MCPQKRTFRPRALKRLPLAPGRLTPGIKPAKTSLAHGQHRWHQYTPDPDNFSILPRDQPYIKLHGSFNWVDQENGALLILGGNKAENIRKHPLLVWYHQKFKEDLTAAGTRLMIIGYSFNDPHINGCRFVCPDNIRRSSRD